MVSSSEPSRPTLHASPGDATPAGHRPRTPPRILTLGLIDGAGTGATIATISILLTVGSGASAAGAVLAAGAAGRIAALTWTARLAGRAGTSRAARRSYTAATLLMALGGVAAVATADRQMLAATALLVILGGTGNNLTSTLAATARHGQITVFYPLLMIGGAGGAAWATHIIQTGRPLVHIQALIALQLAEPALIRPYQQAIRSRPALGRIATSAGRAAALATCAYGPLTAYAILVTVSVGAQHVGASMAAYAAGAASAASADRLLRRNPRYAADGWAGTVALAAAGVATWAAATTIPGLLAGRAASGLLMFLAQGRLLRRSHTEGGEAQVAGASAGLGLGGGLGGLLAARAAQDVGTPIAGVLFAAATLTLIPLGRILAGRTKTRQGDAASDTEEPAAGQERT